MKSARKRRLAASSASKPRSEKMLLLLFFIPLSSMRSSPDQPPPLPGETVIGNRPPLCLFPECVQLLDSVASCRYVDAAVCAINIDANLALSRSDALHRLPVR